MANNGKSKLKLLYLKRILEEETDTECGLSMTQLIERLHDYEIPAERKGVYRDIETLREFGVDIQTYQRNPVQYAIAKRDFALSELMLLVDAVESCRSLTRRQANMLTMNLKLLASDRQRRLLDRRIHVRGRIASKCDSVFNSIDLIHEAMRLHRMVQFLYCRYNLKGERVLTHEGKLHEATPVGITYSDGFYYLTAWNDDHGSMTEFRLDRMDKVRISPKKATKNEAITHHTYEGDEYESFGRFGGEPVTATLHVNADKVEIILDRFGSAADLYEHDARTAKAIVKIHASEQFFGWIAGLGGTVRIHSPKTLKRAYENYLTELLERSRSDA